MYAGSFVYEPCCSTESCFVFHRGKQAEATQRFDSASPICWLSEAFLETISKLIRQVNAELC